jgi:integral membrane protein (TIGR00529 family)
MIFIKNIASAAARVKPPAGNTARYAEAQKVRILFAMNALMDVSVLLKILLSLAAILAVNKASGNLSLALVAGTGILAVWTGHSFTTAGSVAVERFLSPDNGMLLAIIFLIIWLSSQMEKTGVMSDLVGSLRAFLRPRTAMAALPAVIGLLPMPGGALFSAPLVDDADELNEVSPLLKTKINYWFRHIWEYTWPLYPGIILTTEISGLEVWQIFFVGIPLMAASILAGWLFILRRTTVSRGHTSPSEHHFLKLLSPILIIIAVYVLITLFLPQLADFNRYLPMAIGIAAAMSWLQTRRPLSPGIWKGILLSKRALKMAIIVALVRIYGAFIETPLPDGSLLMEQMRRELDTLGIPLTLLVMIIAFASGLTTGVSVGFVGASFPIAFSLLGTDPPLSRMLGMLALAYPFGFIGVMLSPVHVCLIVTNEHYKSSLMRSIVSIVPPSVLVLAISLLLHTLLM